MALNYSTTGLVANAVLPIFLYQDVFLNSDLHDHSFVIDLSYISYKVPLMRSGILSVVTYNPAQVTITAYSGLGLVLRSHYPVCTT